MRRRERGLSAFFPLFSPPQRSAFVADLRQHLNALARFKIPPPDGETPLASAVHGLGMLVTTAMAVTGGAIYLMMGEDGSLGTTGKLIYELHCLLATLMWAYLVGHAGVAVLHQKAGHRVFQGITIGNR
jgi:cytochrome b